MLQYRAEPDPAQEGAWVVGYEVPGAAGVLSVVTECLTERSARDEAASLNAAAAAAEAQAIALATLPRRLVPGFYTDKDAQ